MFGEDEEAPPEKPVQVGDVRLSENGVNHNGMDNTNTSSNIKSSDKNDTVHWRRDCLALTGMTVMVGTAYVTCYLAIGDTFLPPEGMWSIFIIWLAAQTCAILASRMHLPPLLGMLLSGILLKNLPDGSDAVSGLPKSWSSGVRACGLSIILMRSGLELDYAAVKKIGWMAVRLTCFPGICEAFLAGAAAYGILGLPVTLAIALGFILAAVSPAVVVVSMFELGAKGYGISKGVPSLIGASASFDDVVAISGFSMFIGLALSKGSLAMSILHGPIEIISGILTGIICGFVASMTVIWDNRIKRSGIILIFGLCTMFLAKFYHFSGAGAMPGLVMGISVGIFWATGVPEVLSLGKSPSFAHIVESDLALLWKWAAQPLLFGVIGTAIDFREIKMSTVPKSIAVTVIGLFIRLPAAFGAVHGGNLTLKEKLFVGFSWMPKATVQAALASVPLEMIEDMTWDTRKEEEEYLEYGNLILTTAVFSIILTAPLGLIFINSMGPRWLSKDKLPEEERLQEGKKGAMSGSGMMRDRRLSDSFKNPAEQSRILSKLQNVCNYLVGISKNAIPPILPSGPSTTGLSARITTVGHNQFHSSPPSASEALEHEAFLRSLAESLSEELKRNTSRLRRLSRMKEMMGQDQTQRSRATSV